MGWVLHGESALPFCLFSFPLTGRALAIRTNLPGGSSFLNLVLYLYSQIPQRYLCFYALYLFICCASCLSSEPFMVFVEPGLDIEGSSVVCFSLLAKLVRHCVLASGVARSMRLFLLPFSL